MKQKSSLFCVVILSIGTMFGMNELNGQQSFETAYGNGVHHFFNGDYQKAIDSLTLAVGENAKDPRAYFYRGLANERLGNSPESDFQLGARMEAAKGGRLSMVNDALERVQGYSRITIENVRGEALLTAKQSRREVAVVVEAFPANSGKSKGAVASNPPAIVKVPSPDSSVVPGQEIEPGKKEMVSVEPKMDGVDNAVTAVKAQKKPLPVESPDNLKEVAFDDVAPAEKTPVMEDSSDKMAAEKPMAFKTEVDEENPFGKPAGETAVEENATGEAAPMDKVEADEEVNPFGEPIGEADGSEATTEGSEEEADVNPFGEPVGEASSEDAAGEPVEEETEEEDDPNDPFDF